MEATGYIEIKISGQKGGAPLTPENFDISEIRELISHFEDIVFAAGKKQRPVVSYEQKEGSVRSIFRTKSQIILSFAALLAPIKQNPGLEFLQIETARGIESLQYLAEAKDYSIEITTSSSTDERLIINKETNYHLASDALIDADFYLYGEVSTIGGKRHPTVQIDTADFGVLHLRTTREELKKIEDNLVYKVIGVHAKGKQSVRDFEIDTRSLDLVNFLEYAPKKDRAYLNALIERASKAWEGVTDPDAWLKEIRGGEIAA
jgi:hypothetical protein